METRSKGQGMDTVTTPSTSTPDRVVISRNNNGGKVGGGSEIV